MTDNRTTGERYAIATEAHSLKPTKAHSSGGSLDVLTAAGMCGDTLGASLMRLRAEFDGVAGTTRGTGNNSLTDRVLILIQLRTLDEVKTRLGSLAHKQASVTRFAGNAADVGKLTARVLNVFLDPNCDHCEGRGFTGGGRHEESTVPVICRPCHGTGKRRTALGRNDAERAFADHLLALVERAADHAEQEMRRRLR